LDPVAKRLDIHLDFQKGSKFSCSECGAEGRKVHDTAAKTWRHLNFFQYEAYLTGKVPRVHCDACGVHLINNGILEGINSLIQACKARARGYRSKENLISMIYLIAGKLQIGLPT